MKKARIALIGCGIIGNHHYQQFQKCLDIAEIVGFCDIIPERAEELAKQSGTAKAYDNYLDMLNDAKPDAVFIGIPPYCHGEIEKELIKRRIPFYVEKPLALDIDLAKEILALVKEANLVTAVGFQCRYSSLVDTNKKFCRDHKIMYVECDRMSGIPSAPWWKVKDLSGGQIVEQTIHQLDMIRYVFDEPDTVFSMNTRGLIADAPEGYDTDDLSSTVVKFKSGALGIITTGCYVKKAEAFDSKVIFSAPDGRLELKLISSNKIFGEAEKVLEEGEGNYVKGDGNVGQGSNKYVEEKESADFAGISERTFIEAAMSGDTGLVRCDYEDGLRSVAFALACNKSMETGLPVKVDEFFA